MAQRTALFFCYRKDVFFIFSSTTFLAFIEHLPPHRDALFLVLEKPFHLGVNPIK